MGANLILPKIKGLENIGVTISKGELRSIEMQTSFPNIYTCGDVAGPL